MDMIKNRHSRQNRALALLKLLRPEHWTKNLFVFAPVFFGGHFFNAQMLLVSLIGFAALSLAASSIYCLNDICDVDTDKRHPEKCKRPIASGAISRNSALFAMAICFLLSLGVLLIFNNTVGYTMIALVLLYYAINVAYCVKLKKYAIVDVVIIAIGFVLRVLVGGVALDTDISEWLIIMTFLLAFFLAFAKRRDDVVLYESTGVSQRKNTEQYNLEFMNQVITVLASIVIVAYFMWALSPEVIERHNTRNFYITAIFVLMGIIRYLQITIVDLKSGSPTKILLRDRFTQGCIVGWIVSFMVILYL